ncbi:MAG: AAA family ATPase [Planctomycetota bacterium]|jgi:MoxR-like ATPase
MTAHESILQIKARMSESIIGQEAVVERLLVALLANGNVLMEGLPGLAKTRAIKTLAKCIESDFSRIQFTPDLLPADVTGSEIYYEESGKGTFKFQQGPIFGNLILADEINRAPAKVQAALLEAMEERQVTVAGTTYKLPELFLVLATQNPIEQEGTYPLPEAQMDRFLLHVMIHQPGNEDELEILRLVLGEEAATGDRSKSEPIPQQVILDARRESQAVDLAEPVEQYMVALVGATRRPEAYGDDLKNWIRVGASPRGTLALGKAAKAFAWLNGRDHVLPDDVRSIVHDCLRHRLILSYEANADGLTTDDVINELVKMVAVA